jgi:hypothetical protein
MIRSKSFQVSLIGVGLVGLVLGTVDCARRPPTPVEDTGAFRFSLKLSSLAEINSVSYTVSGNGIVPISGMIDLTGSNVASAVVSGLPAAMGYSIAATAASTDKKTKCVGNATFAIMDGSETAATLTLECTGPNESGTGTVRIDGTFDNCPEVKTLVAIPATATTTGGTISLVGTYSDLDGDPVTYLWSQTPLVGAFGSPTAARTTFSCSSVGLTTVSFQVNDGTCAKLGTISIACVEPGVADAGAGGGTGSGGTTAAGGSGAGGATSTGGSGVGGATGTGGASSTGGTTGTGGDTSTADSGAGGDNGVGGATGTGGMGTGGVMACTVPSRCDSLACEQCTFGQKAGDPDLCDTSPDGCFNCDPKTMGCEHLTDPNDQALCEALYKCFVAPTHQGDPMFPNFCISPGGDPIPCWCGSNSLTCVTSNAPPTQANGPCLQQIFAAAKTTDAATINARFIDPIYPVGAAANLAICRGSFCGSECSLPQ